MIGKNRSNLEFHISILDKINRRYSSNILNKNISIILLLFIIVFNCFAIDSDTQLKPMKAFDKYAWMETEQEKMHNWLLSESDRSVNILEKLDWFASIKKRLEELTEYGAEPVIFYIRLQGNNTFYFKQTAQHPYNRLFVKNRFGKETLLIDPPVGYGIYDYYPSYDGQYIAYSISENGSNVSTIKVFNLKTRTHLPDNLSGITDTNLLWAEDNLSFFYHRNNLFKANNIKAGIEEIYLHRLDSDTKKDIVILVKISCRTITLEQIKIHLYHFLRIGRLLALHLHYQAIILIYTNYLERTLIKIMLVGRKLSIEKRMLRIFW